jgi:hypothetical protein
MSTFNFPLASFTVRNGADIRVSLDLGFYVSRSAAFHLWYCLAPRCAVPGLQCHALE